MLIWTASRTRRFGWLSGGELGLRRYARGRRQAAVADEPAKGTKAHAAKLQDAQNVVNKGSTTADDDDESTLFDVEPVYEEDGATEPDLTPEDVRPPFTDAFTTLPGNARTHRMRRHGNRPLPLSPVIDPVCVAARNRWKLKKAPPPTRDELTPFQRKLYANAYAHALATPVRESTTTDTHLPSFFLLPLSIHNSPHPPHAPTWVPSQLWSSTLHTNTQSSHDVHRRSGPQSYIDLSRALLDILASQSTRVRMGLATQAHLRHLGRTTQRGMQLRPDLPDFVLELLRRGVLKSLAWLFRHPNTGLVIPCEGGASNIPITAHSNTASCVLYLVPTTSANAKLTHLERRVAHEVMNADVLGRQLRAMQIKLSGRLGDHSNVPRTRFPSPLQNPAAIYKAARYPLTHITVPEERQQEGTSPDTGSGRSAVVPVYSLHELLGAEKLAELVGNTTFEGTRCVMLKGGDVRTLGAQMALLRLAGYVLQGENSKARAKEGAAEVVLVDEA